MSGTRCPVDARLLQGFLDGELTVDQDRALKLHLRDCQSCRREVQNLQGVGLVIRHSADVVVLPEPGFAQRVAQAAFVGEADQNADFRAIVPMVRRLALIAAAAALVLGFLWFQGRDGSEKSSEVEASRGVAAQHAVQDPHGYLNGPVDVDAAEPQGEEKH